MQYSRGLYFLDGTGSAIIDAGRFSSVGNFVGGLAIATVPFRGTGFIDRSGEFVIEPIFEGTRDFSQGLAAAQPARDQTRQTFDPSLVASGETSSIDRTKWGYIDTSGELVIDVYFDSAYDFSEDVALCRTGTSLFFIDRSGNEILVLDSADAALEYSGDQKFSDGLIVARDLKTNLCGFMDIRGEFVIEPKFHEAASFSEGLARVSIIKDNREYLGFIDRTGEYVIPPKFDTDCDFLRSATDFSEGLASVIDGPPTMDNLDPGYFYIDRTGEVVLETAYAHAGPFREGLAAVYSAEKNRWGLIDKMGNIAIPIEFDLVGEMSEGLVWAGKHGQY